VSGPTFTDVAFGYANARPLGSMSPARRRLLGWAIAASIGGFLFGYQIGVISGALLAIRQDFALAAFEQGALVAVLPLGAMVGGLVAGGFADRLGRRRTLVIDAVVFIIATVISVVAPSYGLLLAARAIAGLAVGAASSTVPLYLSEVAPAAVRGRLVSLNQLLVTLGIVVAYCVDLAFVSSGEWRAMFAVGLVPAAALLLAMARSPETPAWLYAHGYTEEARRVVSQVAGQEEEGERMLESFRHARQENKRRARARDLLESAARPALITGITLALLQQLSGINAVIFFAPSIMEQTGLDASNAILYSVIIGVINVAATATSIRFVDRVGRRPLLILSMAGMSLSLALLGLTFVLPLGSVDSWLALACLVSYITAFAIGLGPIFWLLIAEIFPPYARSPGASVSTATNWFSNFVVSLGFLPIAAAIGQGPTFWIFAFACLLGLAFVIRFVPETRGRSFIEIDADVRARWERANPREAAAY
jgi:sugar porter (SP) family MFS transporter